MKRKYELMFIIDAVLDDAQVEEVANKVRASIEHRGGEIVEWNRWSKRRFAYEIKGRSHGVYYLAIALISPDQIKEIETTLKLNESVLRHLMLYITPRMEMLMEKQNVVKTKLAKETSDRAARATAANSELEGAERPQTLEQAEITADSSATE